MSISAADRALAFTARLQGGFLDVTHNPGRQCVDVAIAWCDELQIERFPGDAGDFVFDSHPDCDWLPYAPGRTPGPGDIVVWGRSARLPAGHVDVALPGASAVGFTGLDQNWPNNPPSPVHRQPHDYAGVNGWLHPRVLDQEDEMNDLQARRFAVTALTQVLGWHPVTDQDVEAIVEVVKPDLSNLASVANSMRENAKTHESGAVGLAPGSKLTVTVD